MKGGLYWDGRLRWVGEGRVCSYGVEGPLEEESEGVSRLAEGQAALVLTSIAWRS